jgi:hypothetical protein
VRQPKDVINFEEGTAMKQQDKSKLGRRDFLRAIGAGAGLAVTAPLGSEAVAAESDAEKKKARYKETDHVKTYYRVNRYPS